MINPAAVAIQALSKHYHDGTREHQVLSEVEVTIRRGEFVVILGRSGSGKSTLLNLIGAMDLPSAGTIEVAGERVERLDERARTLFRRRQIGFVFQAYNLIPTLTVAENLLLPLELNGFEGGSLARVDEYLERLGIADKRDRFPEQLSGGERQRVAIARALVHRPALIIADEPTGNLDIETGRQVLAELDRNSRADGRTLVMATHSREVIGIADRVLSITQGRLQEHSKGELAS